MHKYIKIYQSTSHEAAFNLALEESLLKCCDHETVILYLWQNKPSIIIGKHQNPYKECHIEKIKAAEVALVRRQSGGGAVYHDLGNLNFTFIAHETNYDTEKQYKVILQAIKKWKLQGQISGRNDLTIQGSKFSGNAFMNHNDFICHHGTLLIDVDLERLAQYLTPSPLKIKSKGIDSVKARVINLKSLDEEITSEGLISEIIESFQQVYGLRTKVIELNETGASETLLKQTKIYQSWQWNYGESPAFDLSFAEKFAWGLFEIDFKMQNAIIEKARINTDCILRENFHDLEKKLQNVPLKSEILEHILGNELKEPQIKADLIEFFKINL